MATRQPQRKNRAPVQNRPAGLKPTKGTMSAKERRSAKERANLKSREKRWNSHKLAIPYATDGPKVLYGIFWFFLITGSAMSGHILDRPSIAPVVVAILLGPIAGLAGLQVGNIWFKDRKEARSWAALAAYVVAVAGFAGSISVLVGIVAGLFVLSIGAALGDESNRVFSRMFDLMVRSALPVGLAVASFAAIAALKLPDDPGAGSWALLSLFLLVSAYEASDFIVGSGSSNAIEGPLAGIITMAVVAMPTAFLIPTKAFSSSSLTFALFAVLTMICCPLGQMLASALLPRPTAWAPALRRLDSYLIAAPLWLLLLTQLSF